VHEDVQELLRYVGRYLLERPDQLIVEESQDDGTVVFELTVHEDDRGKLIGKGGETAEALRAVIRAAGALRDEQFQLTIRD
jgi:predicted RNA-binding protein YlqC (UPF0109 family)